MIGKLTQDDTLDAMIHVPFERNTQWRGNYPYEEYVLPTVVENLYGDRSLKRTSHAVYTTTSDSKFGLGNRQDMTADKIPLLESLPADIFAFKFM